MTSQQPTHPHASLEHSHDFDVQKDLHRRIRNDPDYDDWEYGTEPLPHEAWVKRSGRDGSGGERDGADSGA
ncbi:MAG: hypothetical protein AB1Z22_10360 [Synechococcaceae cyanobacterium]